MIPTKLKDLPFAERLKIWDITSLKESYRTTCHIIQTYKIVNVIKSIG